MLPFGFVDSVDILAVRLTQSLSNHSLRQCFAFFAFGLFTKASFRHSLKTKKPVTYVTGFVATIELHSNQIWRDLGAFYSLVGVLEEFFKIKKAGN